MTRWVLLALIAGCAHVPVSQDTPQFRVCKLICSAEGYPLASVLETDDAIDCLCSKPALPAKEGT